VYPHSVQALAIPPQDGQTLWIATKDSIELSINGGQDWISRTYGLPADLSAVELAVNPITPSILYGALDNGHVYKTVNQGSQWITVTEGITDIAADHRGEALALNPFAPDIVLVSRERGPGYRSLDGGQTWEPMSSYNMLDLAFSPYVSGTVYSALPSVSKDNGATWIHFMKDWPATNLSLGLDPARGTPVYIGNEGNGVWRSHNEGQTWEQATDGIAGVRISDIDAATTRPETVYAVSWGNVMYRSDDAAQSWYRLKGVMPNTVAADPECPHCAYVSSRGEVLHNPGGGETWVGGPLTDTTVMAIAVSPISSSVVYAGGMSNEASSMGHDVGKVFRSEDHGISWTELNLTNPISISVISDIAVHPTDPSTVYVSTTCNYCDDKNAEGIPGLGVFRSVDSGETWEPIVNGMGVVPMLGLAINPADPQTIYASGWLSREKRASVFVSTNGGVSWAATDLYEHFDWHWVLDLAVDPHAPHTVFAGSEAGLFWSDDQGTNWNRASDGLGHVSVQSLDIAADEDRSILYIGTVGGVIAGGRTNDANTMLQSDRVQSGVYQKTIDHRPSPKVLYLPLILKMSAGGPEF
jgi:photosystem II stability/assembly factor-like uncharacterized protein